MCKTWAKIRIWTGIKMKRSIRSSIYNTDKMLLLNISAREEEASSMAGGCD
jgi:hypothetical protein